MLRMKFVLLHHSACEASAFHYAIDREGEVASLLAESERGTHAKSIGIVVEGDFDQLTPMPSQLDALRELLMQIKMRYPDIRLGGHRQVRGDATTCPGKRFPLKDLADWAAGSLVDERDAAMQEQVDRQYRPE